MQQTLETAFHADGSTVFDTEFWNRFVLDVAARFRGLQDIKISWEEVSRLGIGVALERINNVITPAAERIQRITEMGFLVASSETPAIIEVGARVDLVVTAGDARDLFSPSPFLLVGRVATSSDYAVARLVGYNRESGLLELLIVSVAGSPGPHSDWSIGAVAGSTIAQLMLLEEGRELAATVIPAVTLALEARDIVQAARAEVLAARDATIAAATPLTPARLAAALAWTRKAAAYAAGSGERIMADTSAAAFTLTLPASGQLEVLDAAGSWPARPLTIAAAKPIRTLAGVAIPAPFVVDLAAHLFFNFNTAADCWIVTVAEGMTA